MEDSSAVTSEQPIEPARRGRVDAARDGWIRALIDKSRRNNLLYYRDLKTGTLELTGAEPTAMARLLKSEEVPLGKLLPSGSDVRLGEARMWEIRSRALMNSEERGLETLFLAMGMASWTSSDGERPPESAVLLVPLRAEQRGRGKQGVSLARAGDIQVNLVLLHVLETEFGVQLTADDLLTELLGDDEGEEFDPRPVFSRLEQAAAEVPGFKTTERLVIGNFAFQKTAMVRDIQAAADRMARHDLIAAIAGDPDAQRCVRERRTKSDPADIDRTPPEDEFLFRDADSSQQLAIRQVLALQDGTIQGPPGTGKSQTIANLIAEFAARGRRVLFVAEKRAALEVVMERLRQAGLGHLALDLHGAEISRREVMERFQESIDRVGSTPPVNSEKTHAKLVDRRSRLLEHLRRLHAECPPTGRSVYAVQGHLVRFGSELSTTTRWRGEALDRLTPDVFDRVCDAFGEFAGLSELFLRTSSSPWTGAELRDGAAAREASETARQTSATWKSWIDVLRSACEQAGLRLPESSSEVSKLLELVREVLETLEVYRPELLGDGQLEALVTDLAPADTPGLQRAWQYVTNSRYRRALRTMKAYRRAGTAKPQTLLGDGRRALDQVNRWRGHVSGSSLPNVPASFITAEATWRGLASALERLGAWLRRSNMASDSLVATGDLLAGLASDGRTPPLLPRLCDIESRLEEAGVQDLVDELRRRRPDAAEFAKWFEQAWLASALERVFEQDAQLAGFDGRLHDTIVNEFKSLDRECIQLSAARVLRSHAERAISVMNEHPDEDDLIRRESKKKFRGKSIRKLLAEAPNVLTALRPCWMASPLSVSHLLPMDHSLFDIVLFDEASQVLPQDAVSALLRADRAVVAGDRHQLPPTSFFLAEEELDTDDDSPAQGFESILDLMSGLFEPWTLDWHYRSLDESLISFSNRHIYSNRLVTFPGPGLERAVTHHLVSQEPTDGQEDSVGAEVARVVDLVLRHASERPSESLGVITLGIRHQQRIERALDEAARTRPELDEFFSETRHERFFVKNLERVQGDERDAIILSVGYGKDHSGKLPYRFGPLLYEGGERRLNVAVTRARRAMTLVSSFDHRDMDPARSHSRGVELLRLYLEFAASGGRVLGEMQGTPVPENEFEQAVHDALAAEGMQLLPQWGASRYRIDLVAKHPTHEGRFVLAIECDGATYHSAQTARDRDRLRQQHLEALGWRFHRIWSTDWFLDRDREVARAMDAYRRAVAAADRQDAAGIGLPPKVSSPEGSTSAPTKAPDRGTRPNLPDHDSIDEYRERDLLRLVVWVNSDGLLRTDDQILDEVVRELGFGRKGNRIVARIEDAIARWRSG